MPEMQVLGVIMVNHTDIASAITRTSDNELKETGQDPNRGREINFASSFCFVLFFG
jgi:hypothetical protein